MEPRYSPVELEKKWYKWWEEKGYFNAEPHSDKPPFSILMPPPNLTGDLHLGHVMQHAIMDSIARYKRMQGHDVLLQPGVDHAGLQFQGVLDKQLSKDGINPKALSREEYLTKAWKLKDTNYASVKSTFTQTGISADWSRELFTLDEPARLAVFEEFKTYYEQGLLYKGPYIVNWCAKCGTAIEDVEMEYQERTEKLYFVAYQVVDLPSANTPMGEIVIATARPETIYADTGIAVHPHHPQFQQFVGHYAINPLSGDRIPIFEDDRVETDFGTGALKITPGHASLDYHIGADHKLPIVHVIGKDGKLTEVAQDLAGLRIEEARIQAEAKLVAVQAIAKIEDYTHQVPVCERCKTTIEPLVSEEWFVKMQPLAQKALQAIHSQQITFLPDNYNEILIRWLEDIHDWTISRSQIWGHRIPVWYKDGQQQVSLESPGEGWVQDPQVLDTWFSSGLWPLSTLGWPQQTTELKRYYPWSLEVTAPEIKFLWIARMIMLGLWFTDEVPFTTMFFHGTLRDLKGQKFSKSLGNGIDPVRLFEAWGVDATRMTLISYSIPGRDARASNQTIDERAKNYRNFATKIWNVARFILSYQADTVVLNNSQALDLTHADDKSIVDRLNTTITQVTGNFEQYELHLAAENIYNFIWNDFANDYLEKTKTRREDAQPVLRYVLSVALKLLHPFMPFVTEEIHLTLTQAKDLDDYQPLMTKTWPKVDDSSMG